MADFQQILLALRPLLRLVDDKPEEFMKYLEKRRGVSDKEQQCVFSFWETTPSHGCETHVNRSAARREEACRNIAFQCLQFFGFPLDSISSRLMQHWHQDTTPGPPSADIEEVEIAV